MLRRLYSASGLFLDREFSFSSGVNLILGRYSEPDSEKRRNKGINGIGKSSLIRLINYLLLSERAEKLFSDARYDFLRDEAHSVTLQLDVRKTPLVIERNFSDKSSSVRIGPAAEALTSYSHVDARKILSGILFPPEPGLHLEGDRYRSLMNFFVKDDLDHQKRADALNFFSTTHNPSEREKNALNFFLLGIPNGETWRFDEKLTEYRKEAARSKELAKKIETGKNRKLAELRAEVSQRQQRMTELRSALDRLDLLESYREIEAELVAVSMAFSEKASAVDQYAGQLRRLRRLSDVRIEVDPKAVAAQFALFSESLGTFAKKQLSDVLAFRTKLAESRTRFHEKRIVELETTLQALRSEIASLEQKRTAFLRILDEKGALQPLRQTYEQLLVEQGDLEREVQVFREIDEVQRRQVQLDVEISQAKQEILSSIAAAEDVLKGLRALYRAVAEEALGLDETELKSAYFDVSPRTGNRRDAAPVEIAVSLPRNDALGRARFEIVAYDLMVFLAAAQHGRQLPDFLIHDGVFHGTSRRIIVNALNFIHRQHLLHPSIQYIATFNEDEIPMDAISSQRDGAFDFDLGKATVTTFTDDPRQMIFGRTFD